MESPAWTWAGSVDRLSKALPSTAEIRREAARMLSQQEAGRAWVEGQAMTLEQAIAYALEELAHD
jgi:hypothetical protein